LKQDGQWKTVDWQTALEYVANGLKQIKADHGAESVGALVSPHSTLEEMSLLTKLIRGLGSDNIDHRLRHAEFAKAEGVRWLGTSIASLSNLQRVLVIGSSLRKDHPLFAQRIRQSVRRGAKLSVINAAQQDWAMPVANMFATPAASWTNALADVVRAISAHKAVNLPTGVAPTSGLDPAAEQIAASLLSGDRKAILLGNAAAHHAQASSLLALANWIGAETGASVGYLTEAANTVGAMLVGAQPKGSGKNAQPCLDPVKSRYSTASTSTRRR
jgi:NADH-quinone oxidoreductase subunit G